MIALLLLLWTIIGFIAFVLVLASLETDTGFEPEYLRLFIVTALCGPLSWIIAFGIVAVFLFLAIVHKMTDWVKNETTPW